MLERGINHSSGVQDSERKCVEKWGSVRGRGGGAEIGRADTYITGFPDSDELISVTREGEEGNPPPPNEPSNTLTLAGSLARSRPNQRYTRRARGAKIVIQRGGHLLLVFFLRCGKIHRTD